MIAETNPMKEFFEKIGQRTFKTESTWWHEVQPGVLLSFPYYKLISPSCGELDTLFKTYNLKAVRFPTPLEGYGFPASLELNTNPQFNLDLLERESRRQTRRGLEACTYQQIDFDFLKSEGLKLNIDTADRQGRKTIYTDLKYWDNYCDAGKATQGMEAWGVLVDGKLGTYLVSAEFDGWWNWLLTHSSSEYLKQRTSNVLFYEGPRNFFEHNPDKKICYGLSSLEDVDKLDYFKINMGVQIQPVKQRIVFAKKYKMVFNHTPEFALSFLNSLFPKSYTVRKATSMIRLYKQQTSEVPKTMEQQDKNGK